MLDTLSLWYLGNGNPSEDVQGLEYTEIWSRDPGYHESMVKILRSDAIIYGEIQRRRIKFLRVELSEIEKC